MVKFLLFAFIFLQQAYALELNDIIPNIRVLKAYEGNFLVLSRGLEDGIVKGDHIKLTNQNGYIARAVCIKTSMLVSHWKIYRVVNPELLSLDDNYRLVSMNQSEMPEDMQGFRNADFSEEYNDYNDATFRKGLRMQQENIAKYDLMENVKKDKLFKLAEKDESEIFMERNFDAEKFKEDFTNYRISLFMSPISFQRIDDQKSVNYGMSIENIGQKYEFAFNYNKMETKMVDQYTRQEVTTDTTHLDTMFNINYITKSLSYFMFFSYDQARMGEIYNPRRQIQGGILGIKVHFVDEGEFVNKFDVSYITTIDYIENDLEVFNENTFETTTVNDTKKQLRHSFRARLRASFSENASLSSTLWYKPVMSMDTQEMDWKDNMTDWTTSLSWQLSESLSASYEFIYRYNIRNFREYGIDPMNQINIFNLNIAFEI